jgi:hypothetical protein
MISKRLLGSADAFASIKIPKAPSSAPKGSGSSNPTDSLLHAQHAHLVLQNDLRCWFQMRREPFISHDVVHVDIFSLESSGVDGIAIRVTPGFEGGQC